MRAAVTHVSTSIKNRLVYCCRKWINDGKGRKIDKKKKKHSELYHCYLWLGVYKCAGGVLMYPWLIAKKLNVQPNEAIAHELKFDLRNENVQQKERAKEKNPQQITANVCVWLQKQKTSHKRREQSFTVDDDEKRYWTLYGCDRDEYCLMNIRNGKKNIKYNKIKRENEHKFFALLSFQFSYARACKITLLAILFVRFSFCCRIQPSASISLHLVQLIFSVCRAPLWEFSLRLRSGCNKRPRVIQSLTIATSDRVWHSNYGTADHLSFLLLFAFD